MTAEIPPAEADLGLPKETAAKLDQIRIWIAGAIFVSFVVLLIFLIVVLGFLLSVINEKTPHTPQQSAATSTPKDGKHGDTPLKGISTAEKMALAASVQVAIGMVMGFVSVFIGLMMTWFGITAAFEFTAKAQEKSDISLKSASPGLLFFLGGIILIGVALYKRIEYQEPAQITWAPTGPANAKVDGVPTKQLPPTKNAEK